MTAPHHSLSNLRASLHGCLMSCKATVTSWSSGRCFRQTGRCAPLDAGQVRFPGGVHRLGVAAADVGRLRWHSMQVAQWSQLLSRAGRATVVACDCFCSPCRLVWGRSIKHHSRSSHIDSYNMCMLYRISTTLHPNACCFIPLIHSRR